MQEHVVDESRGPYFPFNRRETYPKRLKVDFRRLPVRVCVSLSLWYWVCVIRRHLTCRDDGIPYSQLKRSFFVFAVYLPWRRWARREASDRSQQSRSLASRLLLWDG